MTYKSQHELFTLFSIYAALEDTQKPIQTCCKEEEKVKIEEIEEEEAEEEVEEMMEKMELKEEKDEVERDPGVPDEVWEELQKVKMQEELARRKLEEEIKKAKQ